MLPALSDNPAAAHLLSTCVWGDAERNCSQPDRSTVHFGGPSPADPSDAPLQWQPHGCRMRRIAYAPLDGTVSSSGSGPSSSLLAAQGDVGRPSADPDGHEWRRRPEPENGDEEDRGRRQGHGSAAADASHPATCMPPGRRHLCFVGDSHSRYLHNSVAMWLSGYSVAVNNSAKQMLLTPSSSYFRMLWGYDWPAPSEPDGADPLSANCTDVLVNFGQWPASYRAGPAPYSPGQYAAQVSYVRSKMLALRQKYGIRVWWVTTVMSSLKVQLELRGIDWRTDPLLLLFNRLAADVMAGEAEAEAAELQAAEQGSAAGWPGLDGGRRLLGAGGAAGYLARGRDGGVIAGREGGVTGPEAEEQQARRGSRRLASWASPGSDLLPAHTAQRLADGWESGRAAAAASSDRASDPGVLGWPSARRQQQRHRHRHRRGVSSAVHGSSLRHDGPLAEQGGDRPTRQGGQGPPFADEAYAQHRRRRRSQQGFGERGEDEDGALPVGQARPHTHQHHAERLQRGGAGLEQQLRGNGPGGPGNTDGGGRSPGVRPAAEVVPLIDTWSATRILQEATWDGVHYTNTGPVGVAQLTAVLHALCSEEAIAHLASRSAGEGPQEEEEELGDAEGVSQEGAAIAAAAEAAVLVAGGR
ncbi:hypothetical protein HYH03_011794 [Edaphochlamys debaryana]|uniref:Uncharacterized protein n=1 Tax=Edaphochlamys debaryana TaxID=47281 RepID=A0A836BUR7_9CHLO|nr:hypothetical protein HYH03_011794 [Edaphochlamys debaryana]|eukprot:KAG2489685.1 hypothetical protein HYH03_011794 [Edaphochlamys debaryana]